MKLALSLLDSFLFICSVEAFKSKIEAYIFPNFEKGGPWHIQINTCVHTQRWILCRLPH